MGGINRVPNNTPQLFADIEMRKAYPKRIANESVLGSTVTNERKLIRNRMYSIIYRLRKHEISIDTIQRTIYYESENIESMNRKGIRRLCEKYGFVRQSHF